MANEIEIKKAQQAPSTVVNQTGQKNINVEHAENLTQNVTFIMPITERNDDGKRIRKELSLRSDYYHLFVIGNETFETDHFLVPKDRALMSYFTNDVIRNQYGKLTDDAIEEILSFPALLMPEAEGFMAKAADDQYAILAYLKSIRVQDNGIKIRFHEICPIELKKIASIGFELGMIDMDRAISEMNRTHWSIKHINLLEELSDADISILGINKEVFDGRKNQIRD